MVIYLNAANFPNLTVCCIEYLKKHESDTYKFMVTPNVPVTPGILEKATIIDTRDIYKELMVMKLSIDAFEGAKKLATKLFFYRERNEFLSKHTLECGAE